MERLLKAGFEVDIKKYEFLVLEAKYLGLYIGVNGIQMDDAKVKDILA